GGECIAHELEPAFALSRQEVVLAGTRAQRRITRHRTDGARALGGLEASRPGILAPPRLDLCFRELLEKVEAQRGVTARELGRLDAQLGGTPERQRCCRLLRSASRPRQCASEVARLAVVAREGFGLGKAGRLE